MLLLMTEPKIHAVIRNTSFLLDDLWAKFTEACHSLSAHEMAVINDDSFIH